MAFRRVTRFTVLLLAVMTVLAAAAAQGVASASPVQTRFKVGLSFFNSLLAPLWIGQETGIFEKNGLVVETIAFRGSTPAVQSLFAGELDLVFGTPAQLIAAAAAGRHLVGIATLGPKMPYALVGRPGVDAPAKLKGRRFGVSDLGLSAATVATLVAFDNLGLDRSRDRITLVPAGNQPDRLAGLIQGGLDATILEAGSLAALMKQYKVNLPVIADLRTYDIPWDHDVVIVAKERLDGRRELYRAFLKSLLEANAYVLNPANRQHVLQVMTRQYKLSSTELAEPLYEEATTFFVKPRPYASMKALQAIAKVAEEFEASYRNVALQPLLDNSLLQELDRSGFIDGLYQ